MCVHMIVFYSHTWSKGGSVILSFSLLGIYYLKTCVYDHTHGGGNVGRVNQTCLAAGIWFPQSVVIQYQTDKKDQPNQLRDDQGGSEPL